MRLFQELTRNLADLAEWCVFGFAYMMTRIISCGLDEEDWHRPFDNQLPVEPVRVTI